MSLSLSRSVAAALRRGAAQGSWVAAREALAPLEPVTRVWAGRRLRRLWQQARLLTTVHEPSHELRLAALLALKKEPESDVDDEAAVAAELEALGPGEVPRQKPWLTLAIPAGVAALIGLAIAVRAYLAPFDPQRTAVGEALGEGLSDWVVALGEPADARAPALAAAKARTLDAKARVELGDQAAGRLEQLLARAERLADARGDETVKTERDAYFAAANEFGAELGKRQLPYFVDAEVWSRRDGLLPLLLVSYAEREVDVRFGEQRVKALYLWRLDGLRVNWPALGYTRPRTPAALVLLDQVEHDLVGFVLPALPGKEKLEFVDEQTRLGDKAWVADVEARGAELLRRHYGARLREPAIAKVAQLLARRRALVESWKGSLSGQGRTLALPSRLVPEHDYAKELEVRISRAKLLEWDELHEELLSPELLTAFEKLRDEYALSVERHEVQHRLDFMRGFSPVPERLAKLVGLENPLDAPEGTLAASSRHELSAYLSELGDGPGSPLLPLVLMTRVVLNRDSLGGPHSYAVIALLIALGEKLAIDVSQFERRIEREALARLLLAIGARDPAEIRSAARSCYSDLFSTPLPEKGARQVSEHAKWRH